MSSNRHTNDTAVTALEASTCDMTVSRSLAASTSDLRLQCLRVLSCTARALANSPGGLRFKAGTRPWLEGLEPAQYFRCAAGRAAW